MRTLLIFSIMLLAGCVAVPDGIEPVRDFKVNRYLGQWYEIARLDHSFERGLEQVTAHYSTRPDGGIRVINRGFDTSSNRWSEAEGRAYFVDDTSTGHLKVSFFGPFYASYIVFELDPEYQYSLVTSSSRSYLWLLSRTPEINEDLKRDLLNKMTASGFATEKLIFIEQTAVKGTSHDSTK